MNIRRKTAFPIDRLLRNNYYCFDVSRLWINYVFSGTVLRKSADRAIGKRVPTGADVRRAFAAARGKNAMAVRPQGQAVFGHVRRHSDR